MKLDDLLPEHDIEALHHEVIDAEPARVYVVAIEADLARAAHRGRAVAALMAARATPTRLGRALRRRPAPAANPVRLESLPDPGEWVKLDENFGREFVFGAVGRVRSRSIRWRRIHSFEFAGFSEPGHARVATNLSLRPDGGGRTVLSFELRAQATDPETRRRLTRYWRFGRRWWASSCAGCCATSKPRRSGAIRRRRRRRVALPRAPRPDARRPRA